MGKFHLQEDDLKMTVLVIIQISQLLFHNLPKKYKCLIHQTDVLQVVIVLNLPNDISLVT